MKKALIILAALVLWTIPAEAQVQDIESFSYSWSKVGDEYVRDDGRVEQKIEVAITFDGEPTGELRAYPIRWEAGASQEQKDELCEQMASDYYNAYMSDRIVELDQYARQTGEILQGELYEMWSRMIDRVRGFEMPTGFGSMTEEDRLYWVGEVEGVWQEECAAVPWLNAGPLGDYVAELTGQGFTNPVRDVGIHPFREEVDLMLRGLGPCPDHLSCDGGRLA